jgi:lysozyme
MVAIKQMLLALGVMASPLDHPPEPCLDNCQILDVGRALVRNFEGYSPLRYRDSAGLWTIGVGHLIRPGERFEEPLLGDAAEALFQKDLAPKVAAVNARVSVPLYQGQFDAAVSLVYNIGEGAFAKSTALKKINAAQHEEVPAQIKRWNKAGGRIVKGLERRREAEAELYGMRWY